MQAGIRQICFWLLVLPTWGSAEGFGQTNDGQEANQKLTLDQCIQLALQNNLGLKQQALLRDQAALDVKISEEKFWPTFFSQVGVRDERNPPAHSASASNNSETWVYNAGVEVLTPVGTSITTALTNFRRGTNDSSVLYDPEYQARLELALSQPLLRGLGIGNNMIELEQSKFAYQVAKQNFRGDLNRLIASVEQAYWNLYFAEQDVDIKQRLVQRARRQFEDTQENIRRGILPEHDIYVVEENLVSFEKKRSEALNELASAQATLAELMQQDPNSIRPMIASQPPEPDTLKPPDVEDLLAMALVGNPELLAFRAQAQAAELELKFEKNARLPTLDLEASLALNGVADSFSDAYHNIGAADDRDAFLGLKLEMPIFDLWSDSKTLRAEQMTEGKLLKIKELEQKLLYDIHNIRRDILQQLRSYRQACKISNLARKKLEAQQEKYQAGVAALKDLVQFMRELDEAEIEQVRALVELLKEVVQLHLSVGSLHRIRGIELP